MSVITAFLNSKEFSKMILKGKEQGHLVPDEINDFIPASIVDYKDIDMILIKLEEMNISVNKFRWQLFSNYLIAKMIWNHKEITWSQVLVDSKKIFDNFIR